RRQGSDLACQSSVNRLLVSTAAAKPQKLNRTYTFICHSFLRTPFAPSAFAPPSSSPRSFFSPRQPAPRPPPPFPTPTPGSTASPATPMTASLLSPPAHLLSTFHSRSTAWTSPNSILPVRSTLPSAATICWTAASATIPTILPASEAPPFPSRTTTATRSATSLSVGPAPP